MTKLLIVFRNHAYMSELALYKHEGLALEQAQHFKFKYEGDPPKRLWRVYGGPQVELVTTDYDEAVSVFYDEALAGIKADLEVFCFHDVAVLGINDKKGPCKVIVSRGIPECVLAQLYI